MYTQSQRREFMNREEVEEVEVEEEEEKKKTKEKKKKTTTMAKKTALKKRRIRREEPAPLFESVPRPALRGVQARAPTRGGKQTKLYRRKITSR